jgi:hypothetical protein
MQLVRSRMSAAAVLPALAVAAVGFALHAILIEQYGWFRDEFYYVVCGERLAFGYVDHPPLVAVIARLARTVLGDSLAALRLPSIGAGALVVLGAGLLAREMGGNRFAQLIAALCALIAPVYLFLFHIFSMNSFDVLFWTAGALVLARILTTGRATLWLLFGAVAGLGLLNKHSMLFFGFGVAAGLLLTRQRLHLRSPWFWLGGSIAAAMFLPHLLWQARHGWPTIEFIRNATRDKNLGLSPAAFAAEQVLQMHPLTLPIWLGGLLWLLLSRDGRPFRVFGIMYLAIAAVLISQSSKAYYLAPVYPVLFAAGSTAIASRLDRLPPSRGRSAAAAAMVFVLATGGAALAPLTLPVLPVARLTTYLQTLGVEVSSGERHRVGSLPQHFADMHGWDAILDEIERVYRSLPAGEREVARVFGQNYGEAGAVDVLGRQRGLPRALSGHNNYFLWGPGDAGTLIVIGGAEDDNRRHCAGLERAGLIRCGLCMPYEDEQPVYICRGFDPADWPAVKNYN